MVRAKFYLGEVTQYSGNKFQKKLVFYPVTSGSDENKRFFAATPTGKLEMNVITEVADTFEVGKEYYMDFTLAVVPEAAG